MSTSLSPLRRLSRLGTSPGARRFLGAALSLVLVFMLAGCQDGAGSPSNGKGPPLRLGWQPPWANQGQIVTVLKTTDLLAHDGIAVEYVPFTYGGPMGEAALAGRIDIMLAGDQPVLTLLSRSDDWRIVARMTNYRSAILVPLQSPATSLEDLMGMRIATAFGSTTHRDLMRMLEDAGLKDEVQVVNVDQAEQAGVIAAGGEETWGELAAIASYDPTVAASVQKSRAKILKAWASPGLVAVRREIVEQHPDLVRSFLRAYAQAFVAYAETPEVFDDRYTTESRLALTAADYRAIAAFEPNMQARALKNVNIRLTEKFLQQLDRNADVARQLGIIRQKPDLKKMADVTLAP